MNKKVLLVAGAGAIAVAALWFFFLWGPQGGRIDDARNRQKEAEQANAQLELRVNRLQDVAAREPELTAALEELRVAVPDTPGLAEFLLDAQAAADQSGIDFVAFSPAPPAANTEDPTLPAVITLSININGGYFQVLDYLNRLDDMPRIVVTDTLSLTAAENEAGGQDLTVALAARMFTNASPQSAGGIGVESTTTTTTTTAPEGETTTTSTTAGAGG